jgi:dihydroorotase
MSMLIQNGTIINGGDGETRKADILIVDKLIARVEDRINSKDAEEVFDAEGKYVLPGLIDAHCHLREPGFEYKEDIESGSVSAVFGGFTTIACMPNTEPVTDNKIVLDYILNRARQVGLAKIIPIVAVTVGQKGEQLTDFGLLAKSGAGGFSDDGRPVKNAAMMKKALEIASMYQLPVISHCEDPDLAVGGVMNEGEYSLRMGLRGIPTAAEDVMVAREIILAEYTNTPVHIAHVSTEGAIELIRQAKRRHVKVTAETCPHYFSITEEICSDFNTYGKVNPPLRTAKDMEAVIEGLKDGTIDMIATDHAPHHEDEKKIEFEKAANGIIGFETALALSITKLVEPGHLTMNELVMKMCVNPALLLNLKSGRIEKARPADLILVDLKKKYQVDRMALHSKSKNSPYHGMKLIGEVNSTIIDGKCVVRDRTLTRAK